ncbi:MAG: hypothetical protein LBD89_03185 [Tannerellaceae bacterium]|nr:hypothetical protein [Tannerellaceae bacterium]
MFGVGGSCLNFSWGGGSGGGGGGYYGGDGNATRSDDAASGSGGSSFISGMTGCVAIDPTSNVSGNPRTHTGEVSLRYSNSVFGASPTWNNNEEILFTNPSMIDGQGYEWNTGTGSRGNQTLMPSYFPPVAP